MSDVLNLDFGKKHRPVSSRAEARYIQSVDSDIDMRAHDEQLSLQ